MLHKYQLITPKQLYSHEALTSTLMIRQGFEEIKGRCGAILHWQKLAQAGRVWRTHAAQLSIQSRL